MKDYIKLLRVGIGMEYKIEAKANDKDAGAALKIASIGLAIMFACIGVGVVLFAI